MRIVFMGTPDIAAGVLEALIGSEHEIVGVVTQPDKPNARGNEIVFSAVKKTALAAGLPVFQPVKASSPESVEELAALKPDIVVVVAYGQLLRQNLLDMPKYGCINVHASLLPKYRGASPIQWAVINGEKESGVTIMHMAAGLDTGDIILQRSIELAPDETAGSLFDKLTELSGPVLLEALEKIENGTAERIPQDDSESSYVSVLTKAMGRINFNKPAEELERLIRGLIPWPGAYTYVGGKLLKLWKVGIADEGITDKDGGLIIAAPGQLRIDEGVLYIGTSEGMLEVYELQLEGKKRMYTSDFLRGSAIADGTFTDEADA